ncbi:hypothetical protein [Roseovarius mucosus]|uniref:hypothetical protein n=1 Tax=Roseovarius mucosus TaxID=215743 RepID=UPI0035CF3D37
MTPHDKWTSADIARHTADAMREDVAEFSGLPRKRSRDFFDQKYDAGRTTPTHYADERAGFDSPRPRRVALWFALALIIGALIGGMTLAATPAPYTGPGYEAACWGGC